MSDRPYYCVPDGGRTTVLRRVPNSRAQTVATMLSETQALALATTLNDFCATVDECLSTIRRERAQFTQVVTALRNLYNTCPGDLQDMQSETWCREFEAMRTQAGELLAAVCPRPKPATF